MPVYESEARLGLDVIPDLPTPQDLHNRFIPGSLIPHGQSSSGSETIELTIDNDYTMHLGEHEIVLGGLEIYVFNTLLLLRDRQPTASELRSLGFTTTSSSPAAVRKAFRNAYELLVEQLNVNDNQPLVAAEGDEPESAHYSLNPNLVVTDRRTHEAQVASTPIGRTALDFLIDHGTRAEKEKAGPRGELYTRIVTLEQLPSVPSEQAGSPIEVEIVDNTTIRIGDKLLRLGPHERYLFNALMLRRDSRSAARELKSFGFYPGAKEAAANTAFYKATQDLSGHVNGAAGTEVIAKFGQKKATRYALNPNLVLRDLRTEEDLAREVIDIRKISKSFGRSAERREIPNVGNLYARLIDSDRIPNIPLREGRTPIQATIVDNTTLRIGDQDVRLSAHERYLFNALMLLRGQPNAAGELRAFGFYPNAQNSTANVTFSRTINNLVEQLNGAAGVQILRRFGQKRSTRYIVNPDLMVVDFRSDEDRAAELDDLRPINPRATAGASEFRELTEEGDLYERIIDIERIPHMDVNDGTSVELLIDDNTTLRVGGHLIKLSAHERYLFNALMLLREQPASGKELRQFSFFPGAKTGTVYMTFSKTMTSLIDRVNEALGVEVFKKIGERRSMHYAVNPNLVLTDLRTDQDKARAVVDEQIRRGRPRKNSGKYPELEEGYMPNGKRANYKGPAYEGYGADAEHYDDSERRTLLITELVQRYKDHPQVQEALRKLNNGAPIQVGPEQPYYRYLAEISQYDLLNPDDEVRLFKILENGVNLYKDWGAHEDNEQALIDAVIARQIVYLSNLRLVVEHAKRWAAYSKTMGRLDYVQEGNIGLADAIDRFDHTRGFRFSTYATWWVKQAIQRSQADKDRLIRIPVHMHDRLVGFSKTVRELTSELNRDPNPWEIAYKLDEPVADVLKLQGYIGMEPASLNALIEDSGRRSGRGVRERIDQIADPNDEIAQATQEAEDVATVEALFSKRNLTLPEKYVVSYRLGFVVESLRGTVLEYTDGTVVRYNDLVAVMTDPEVSKNTLEEAGKLFGVTRERIRQIEKIGLDKIRLTYGRK